MPESKSCVPVSEEEVDVVKELRRLATECGNRTVLLPKHIVDAILDESQKDNVDFAGINIGPFLYFLADMME